MRRWQKIVTTAWTTILVAPLLYVLFAFARMECGELDPCPTGGSMPFAPLAILLVVATVMLHVAFMFMLWAGVPEQRDTGDNRE